MSARVEVSSESGVVALAGPTAAALPAGLDQEPLLRQLEPLVHSAELFFLVTDDPVRYRIDVIGNEPLPPGLERDFEALGGAFRLEAPSRRVVLIGWDKAAEPREAGGVSVSPGAHLVSLFARRPFDGRRHAEDMAKLLGDDAKFVRIVDRLGLIGCLPMILVAISVLIARWRWLWYLVPLLAVSWMPYMILKCGGRYRRAERRASEAERARPHYVIGLAPTRHPELRGGYVRV
ncbi:MAG TPA: hypothetical protein VKG20_14765 [Methylomirabilota bacterium]|nr:hypothetical protein [Methylomirabilota bacterium]